MRGSESALPSQTALPAPFRVFSIPHHWLVAADAEGAVFDSRLITTAMLIGVVAAALTDRARANNVGRAFCEGGYAVANIVSVIVVAHCFGIGVKESGLVAHLHQAIAAAPELLPASALTGAEPLAMIRRTALPLLAGICAVVMLALLLR